MLNADSKNRVEAGDNNFTPSLWLTLLLTASAGGMGWGIRGQYGHQTGAMVAGLLVALVVGMLYCHRQSSLFTARFVAMTAVGISFGGSMTYGQTVGLTHDAELHGNWPALWSGMLGLFIKGGVWVGFAGVLLGMGAGSHRYRPIEMALLFLCLMVLLFLGIFLLNEPYDPEHHLLPRIYFSDDRVEFTPAAECAALSLHAVAIVVWTFVSFDALEAFADHALTMGILPLALILGGRYSPYLVALPVILLPIAGKTLRELSYRGDVIAPGIGWLVLSALPMTLMIGAALLLVWRGKQRHSGCEFCRWSLLLTSWTYFALNFAFFRFPWPWNEPTGRTPSALIFAVCLLSLTVASLACRTTNAPPAIA